MVKDSSISSIRMIATIMIVALHISQQLEALYSNAYIATDWLNLGLVLFFCMSGYLYSRRTIGMNERKGWMLHRYKEIVFPSIITVVATLVIYALCIEIPERNIIINSIASGLGFEAFVTEGWMFVQLWFLSYILVCYLSVPFIQKVKVEKMTELQFWGILVIGTVIFQGSATLIQRVIAIPLLSWGVLLRFYLTYFLFRRYGDSDRQRKIYQWMALIAVMLLILVCFVRYILCPQGILGIIAELFFIYSQTIIGTVLFYYIRKFFQKYPTNKILLGISDRYSYAIYLTHCLFIGYSTSVIFKCENIAVGIFIAILLTAFASITLQCVVEKIKKCSYTNK